MDTLISLMLFHIGWAVFPAAMLFSFSRQPMPVPSPTLTPTLTASPSPVPTNTVTPTPHPLADTNTPTPSPSPAPTPPSAGGPVTSGQLDQWFTRYSNHYSIDRQKLWNVSVCESNLNPDARNGDYGGLYQFSTNTWISTRKTMNLDSNPSLRFNAEEAIRTAAFKISTAGLSPWPNCGKK